MNQQQRDDEIRATIARFDEEITRLKREAAAKERIRARWQRLLTCPHALAGKHNGNAAEAA
jgi:hypothetical protein